MFYLLEFDGLRYIFFLNLNNGYSSNLYYIMLPIARLASDKLFPEFEYGVDFEEEIEMDNIQETDALLASSSSSTLGAVQ